MRAWCQGCCSVRALAGPVQSMPVLPKGVHGGAGPAGLLAEYRSLRVACRDCKEGQRCGPRAAEASQGCNQHHSSSPTSTVHKYRPRLTLHVRPHQHSRNMPSMRPCMHGGNAVHQEETHCCCAADCEPAAFSYHVAAADEGQLYAATAKPPAKMLQAQAPSPKALTGSKQLLKAALTRPQAQPNPVALQQIAPQQGRPRHSYLVHKRPLQDTTAAHAMLCIFPGQGVCLCFNSSAVTASVW